MRLFRYFIMPLLGAIYASGWWAFAIWGIDYCKQNEDGGLIIPLVLLGIAYGVFIGFCIYLDYEDNR